MTADTETPALGRQRGDGTAGPSAQGEGAGGPAGSSRRWRVGKHYGIHVYEVVNGEPGTENEDLPVATFHTVADARAAVDAFNATQRSLDA